MTAHTRTTSLSPSFSPAIKLRWSTRRIVLVAASFLLEAVIVLGFVGSSLGVGVTTYQDPGPGRLAPPARTAPVSAVRANPAPVIEPAPAPAPAP
jgi:hypothetical protein